MGGGQACHPMSACAPHTPAPKPCWVSDTTLRGGPDYGGTSIRASGGSSGGGRSVKEATKKGAGCCWNPPGEVIRETGETCAGERAAMTRGATRRKGANAQLPRVCSPGLTNGAQQLTFDLLDEARAGIQTTRWGPLGSLGGTSCELRTASADRCPNFWRAQHQKCSWRYNGNRGFGGLLTAPQREAKRQKPARRAGKSSRPECELLVMRPLPYCKTHMICFSRFSETAPKKDHF